MNAPTRQPPRYVPTLTEVIQPASSPVAPALPDLAVLQEQIVHRVMQRVDLSMEQRLREAVAVLVLEETRNLVPMLREEIERVVKQSVAEAVAAELPPASGAGN